MISGSDTQKEFSTQVKYFVTVHLCKQANFLGLFCILFFFNLISQVKSNI